MHARDTGPIGFDKAFSQKGESIFVRLANRSTAEIKLKPGTFPVRLSNPLKVEVSNSLVEYIVCDPNGANTMTYWPEIEPLEANIDRMREHYRKWTSQGGRLATFDHLISFLAQCNSTSLIKINHLEFPQCSLLRLSTIENFHNFPNHPVILGFPFEPSEMGIGSAEDSMRRYKINRLGLAAYAKAVWCRYSGPEEKARILADFGVERPGLESLYREAVAFDNSLRDKISYDFESDVAYFAYTPRVLQCVSKPAKAYETRAYQLIASASGYMVGIGHEMEALNWGSLPKNFSSIRQIAPLQQASKYPIIQGAKAQVTEIVGVLPVPTKYLDLAAEFLDGKLN